jgi:flagellar hook-associated protein 3 FlgL
MRISTNTLYSNFIFNQQMTYSSLNDITNQLSSGMKIDKMADNPTIFTNTLRLDSESNSLKQVVTTSKSAQTFANNTDTTMNEMTKTLETFKTKLLQAANGDNSITSYHSLAGELKGLRDHLKELANTSIDGKFLFSGTAFNTKPISDNGDYNGNDKNIKAKLGSKIETPYNIDGASLFEGIDRDYSKHIITNVKHFDKMKENPKFVVFKDGKYYIDKNLKEHGQVSATDDNPEQVSLSTDSQIRMLTGVSDIYNSATDSYSDGTSYFYINGRNPKGESFSKKFALSNDSTIDDLLNRIGESFGNTQTAKAVDVTMNQFGQIEVKDTTTGKMVTDFNLVASDKDENSVDDIVKNGDYIVSFTKSDFPPIRDIATPSAQNKNFDNRVFTLNSEFRTIDNETFAKSTDKIFNVLGEKGLNEANTPATRDSLHHIRFTGTDTDGNSVDVTLNVDNTTTMKDLENEIQNNFGDVSVSIEKGKLVIFDNTIEKDEKSNFSLTIDAENSSNDSLSMFGRVDGITDDKTQFNVNGRFVTSNVPQVDKNKQMYATENTRMIDVSGKDDIDGKKIDINYTDKDGNIKRAYITLKDTEWTDGSGNKHFSTFTTIADDGTETIYDIYDNEGNKTPIHDKTTITQELDPETCKLCNKTHTTKGITYKQLNDVIGMLVSGNLPQDSNGDGKYDFTEYKKGKDSSKKVVNVGMENGKIFIEDKQNATTKIKFAINDRDSDSYDGSSPVFKFNSNNGITIDESKVDIFHQLDEIIKSVENGKVRVDGDSKNPRERGIQEGIELIDHLQDHIIKKHTEIGAISKSLQNTEERNNMLIVHVETLKSSVIDVDMAEASLKLQKLTLNYNAMLSTISKVNGLSLVNYMK